MLTRRGYLLHTPLITVNSYYNMCIAKNNTEQFNHVVNFQRKYITNIVGDVNPFMIISIWDDEPSHYFLCTLVNIARSPIPGDGNITA